MSPLDIEGLLWLDEIVEKLASYEQVGEFWDTHDLSDYWDATHEVEFQVKLGPSVIYFPVDRDLAEKLRTAAHDRGISPDALLNVWLKEHVTDRSAAK